MISFEAELSNTSSAARTSASLMPNYVLFGLALVVIGISTQTFTTSTNSLVQISTDPAMRGRVIAILLAISLGTTPLGAPVVGWVADRFGPRWALGVGAASGFTSGGRCRSTVAEVRPSPPTVMSS